MTLEDKINRINELYRKSKAEGLTEEEKAEQAQLRKDYISSFRASMRAQLNNIDMVNPDGTVTNLGDLHAHGE